MTQSWAHHLPTLARVIAPESTRREEAGSTTTALPAWAQRVRQLATSPVTALVVMALGLFTLFVVPTVGLVFVAVVVLPVVVHQLRAEQRHQYRLRQR